MEVRMLTPERIEELARQKGVRKIAVENFLMSLDLALPMSVQLANLALDARLYGWNSATIEAIRQGIAEAYQGRRQALELACQKEGGRMAAKARFRLGQLVATPGALKAIAEAGQEPLEFLARHQAGDWGEVSAEDQAENEYSLAHGLRLLSAYRTAKGVKLWVITEADRSVTTILLPEEY